MNNNTPNTLPERTTSRSDSALREELLARCRAIGPTLARNVSRSELDRRVPTENIDVVANAELFRLAIPKRHGGFQTDLRTMIDVSACLAQYCGSTAWIVANAFVTSWVASLLSGPGQDEVFADGPHTRIAGSSVPSNQMRRVEGGFVVSGKWYYASGSASAQWGFLTFAELDAAGQLVDQFFSFVPMRELALEDTWFTTGMRGTASNCLIANELFIPAHRVLSVLRALEGEYPSAFKSEVLYRSTLSAFLPLNLLGPLLGLGRAALRHVVDHAAKRNVASTTYRKQSESTAAQLQVADAAMKLETAQLHVSKAIDDVEGAAWRGEQLDRQTRARIRGQAAYAAGQVVDAVNALVAVHGAGSFAESNPMQQIWRDVSIAARHATLIPHVGLEVYGKALLSAERNITLLL